MTYTRAQAVRRALASTHNKPDTCQLWTREIFGVDSVGDYDGDGAADAEDGWKSEPARYKHPGDRHPPEGVPVSYGGGSEDNGHRAVSLGPINGRWMIRSTDAGGRGIVATVPLDWPERAWGLHFLGWSETCDRVLIPDPPPAHHHTSGPSELDLTDDAEHAVWQAQHKVAVNTPDGADHRPRWRKLHRALNILRTIGKKGTP